MKFSPKLQVSSGGVEYYETRESFMKKPRVDADMEISATETPSWKSIEQLDTANKTLHRAQEEIPRESEAVTCAAELNSIRDKRV